MQYKVEFQFRPQGSARPLDYVQEIPLVFRGGEFLPIPSVGDSVSYDENGRTVAYKVVSRHYSYLGEWCVVNIVVTDMSDGEMAARLKE
jgi:hypothetical protein